MRGKVLSLKGFSLIEMLIAIVIIVILSLVLRANLRPATNRDNLNFTTEKIVASLRDAQTRSVAKTAGAVWGVHLQNSTTSPFFSTFKGSYSATSGLSRYPLPFGVQFVTSSIAQGGALDVTFAKLSGLPLASSSIVLKLVSGGTVVATSGITISARGLIY